MPAPGQLEWTRRIRGVATCGDCERTVQAGYHVDVEALRKYLRERCDWSLGRDKLWRCALCRPRRFGEAR